MCVDIWGLRISKTPEMTEHFSRYLQISDVIYRYQIFEEKMELVYIAALTEITFLSEIYGIVKIAEVWNKSSNDNFSIISSKQEKKSFL